ncbi:MAG TPA: hypothetical protein PKL84_17780, partial [Candidatus Hydrogenedentes bacterium]|nr:hypothetical protein [Candidatus Hydrogenedentota bacterium]
MYRTCRPASYHSGKNACLLLALLTCLAGNAFTASADDPWADAVVDYHAINPNAGFNAPDRALGAPL